MLFFFRILRPLNKISFFSTHNVIKDIFFFFKKYLSILKKKSGYICILKNTNTFDNDFLDNKNYVSNMFTNILFLNRNFCFERSINFYISNSIDHFFFEESIHSLISYSKLLKKQTNKLVLQQKSILSLNIKDVNIYTSNRTSFFKILVLFSVFNSNFSFHSFFKEKHVYVLHFIIHNLLFYVTSYNSLYLKTASLFLTGC